MKLFIDADGCPVVDETVAIARRYHLPCFIFCDTSHYFNKEGATTITVSKGPTSVDFALVNQISAGDIVITQDYGLATLCMAKGAIPIHQDGMIYDNNNIEALLLSRHMNRKLRAQGAKTPHMKKRTQSQNQMFQKSLLQLIEKLQMEDNSPPPS